MQVGKETYNDVAIATSNGAAGIKVLLTSVETGLEEML